MSASYTETIFFKPVKITKLPATDCLHVAWLTRKLHGPDWDKGEIRYLDIKTICLDISFRLLQNFFVAKGTEEFDLLSKLLRKSVYNLEDFLCPRRPEIFPKNSQLL